MFLERRSTEAEWLGRHFETFWKYTRWHSSVQKLSVTTSNTKRVTNFIVLLVVALKKINLVVVLLLSVATSNSTNGTTSNTEEN